MAQHSGPAEVVSAVLALPAGRTRWVGIDGPGGAGKSTLAEQVAGAVAVTGRAVDIVHVDDFSGMRFAEWDWQRFDDQVLAPLLAGCPARYQRFDWVRDEGGEWVEVEPGAVMVVEGVSATRAEVRAPWDLTVWVDAPAWLRHERALARDGAGLWPVWRDRWIPAEQAYAARERPWERVDFIVPGA